MVPASPVHGKVAIAELAEGDRVAGSGRLSGGLSVEPQERYNIHPGWEFDEALFDSHEEVVGLIDLGLGFRQLDVTEGEAMAFPVVQELAVRSDRLAA